MGKFINKLLYSILLASSVAAASAKDIDAETLKKSTVAAYTVKQNETLSSIAEKLGLSSYHQIEDVNKGLNPNRLKVGQQINVPVYESHLNGVHIDVLKVKSALQNSAPAVTYYEVQSGDTLYGIAKKFGTSLNDIYSENPLLKNHPDSLSIGHGIFIKKGQIASGTKSIEDKLAVTAKPKSEKSDNATNNHSNQSTNYASTAKSAKSNSNYSISNASTSNDPPKNVQSNNNVQNPNNWYVAFSGPQIKYEVPGRHMGGANSTIDKILVHITDAETASSTISWFTHPNPPPGKAVSAHYLIDLDGKVIQFVPEDRIAYHCQGSNKGSIGIEFVGKLKDGGKTQSYTEKQLAAGVGLVVNIMNRHKLNQANVFGHFQFDDVKRCPGVANYTALMNLVGTATRNSANRQDYTN